MIRLMKDIFNKYLLKHLLCPSICVIVSALYFFMVDITIKSVNYKKPITLTNNIIKQFKEYSQECKEDYWWSLVVFYEDEYYIVDVIGYDSDLDDKVYSVKYKGLNSCYFENGSINKLDSNSQFLLANKDTGLYSHLNIEDLAIFESFYNVLGCADSDIKEVGFSVTRDKQRDLIFVFIVTSSLDSLTICNKENLGQKLREIAIYTKTQL